MKVKFPNKPDFEWAQKWPSLREYFEHQYNSKYYRFELLELNIDPTETFDEIESYDKIKQEQELIKCAQSFPYFCHKYIKVTNSKTGLVPFVLFNYQRRAIQDFDNYQFNVVKKFRTSGVTTLNTLWGLWKCMFKSKESIAFISRTDNEVMAMSHFIKNVINNLPTWLAPKLDKNNDYEKICSETNSKMIFRTAESFPCRAHKLTWLIIDEAAFILKMKLVWLALWPCISNGGKCIIASTPNGKNNWFAELYQNAILQRNNFHVIDLNYKEHPSYHELKKLKQYLSKESWKQEILAKF